MINMLAKAQKSWFAKTILTLTALSFMSLFGISGYINSAGKNRRVIKVDNIEISQAEFHYMLQKEQDKLRNLMGDEYLDKDDVQSELIQKIANREVFNAILNRTAQKNNISISDDLIMYGIWSQPEFSYNGKYNPQMLKSFLSHIGLSQAEYIEQIRRNIVRQVLTGAVIDKFATPSTLTDLYSRLFKHKRQFAYILADPDKVKVDREISEDEIEQYYTDFSADFIEPETRDADLLLLSNQDILKTIVVSDEEIADYYQEHIDDYEQQETREVLQMMFSDEESANKAFFELKSGKEFLEIAKTFAKQTEEETNFGYITKDMLTEELQNDVFALPLNGITKPIQSENGWHIMKVATIVPMSKMNYQKAKADIVAKIKEDRLYDEVYDFVATVEDKVNEDKSLQEIANETGTKIYNVKNLAEDGSYKSTSLPKEYAEILKSSDIVDAVFSYNIGEISQAVEADNGFILSSTKNIYESREKTIDEVLPEIKKLWAENEKSVIIQEIVNDVMHDLEEGDDIKQVAKRFGLKLIETKPLTRGEAFGDLSTADIMALFHEDVNTPKLLNKGKIQVIAVTRKDIIDNSKESGADLDITKEIANNRYLNDLSTSLVNDFGRNYDIRIKYRLMGLPD